jgi:hypothetical protein
VHLVSDQVFFPNFVLSSKHERHCRRLRQRVEITTEHHRATVCLLELSGFLKQVTSLRVFDVLESRVPEEMAVAYDQGFRCGFIPQKCQGAPVITGKRIIIQLTKSIEIDQFLLDHYKPVLSIGECNPIFFEVGMAFYLPEHVTRCLKFGFVEGYLVKFLQRDNVAAICVV